MQRQTGPPNNRRLYHQRAPAIIMTLTMDPQQRQLGAIGFDHMSYPPPQPQFTNPWASTNSVPAGSHMFPAPLSNNNAGFDALAKQQAARHSATSMAYTSAPVSAPALSASNGYSSSPYDQQQMLGISQDPLSHSRASYEHGYTTSSSPAIASYAPTSAPYIGSYAAVSHHGSDGDRRQ